MAYQVAVTNTGAAMLASAITNGQILTLSTFEIATGYGYDPTVASNVSQAVPAFQGATLISGATVLSVSGNVLTIVCSIPTTVVSSFGEIGIWATNTTTSQSNMFAIMVFNTALPGSASLGSGVTEAYTIDFQLTFSTGQLAFINTSSSVSTTVANWSLIESTLPTLATTTTILEVGTVANTQEVSLIAKGVSNQFWQPVSTYYPVIYSVSSSTSSTSIVFSSPIAVTFSEGAFVIKGASYNTAGIWNESYREVTAMTVSGTGPYTYTCTVATIGPTIRTNMWPVGGVVTLYCNNSSAIVQNLLGVEVARAQTAEASLFPIKGNYPTTNSQSCNTLTTTGLWQIDCASYTGSTNFPYTNCIGSMYVQSSSSYTNTSSQLYNWVSQIFIDGKGALYSRTYTLIGGSSSWSAWVSPGGVSSVSGSGGSTGLTLTGGPITSSGTLTLGGVLGTSNGGTGISATPSNGTLLIGNGSGYSLSTLTAGSNVVISNGAGGITISATTSSGGGGTVSYVNGSGGSTGLTLTGGPITSSGTLTLGGVLGTSNGGTGISATPSNGTLLIGNGSGFSLGNLHAGPNIAITNGSGSITIGTSGSFVTSVDGNGGAVDLSTLASFSHSYGPGVPGYTRLPGGLIIQWGAFHQGDLPAGHSFVTINYPIAFPSYSFCITLGIRDVNQTISTDIEFSVQNNVGFVVGMAERYSIVQDLYINWISIGY